MDNDKPEAGDAFEGMSQIGDDLVKRAGSSEQARKFIAIIHLQRIRNLHGMVEVLALKRWQQMRHQGFCLPCRQDRRPLNVGEQQVIIRAIVHTSINTDRLLNINQKP